jgi:peptide chain release factor subunit 1
LLDRSTIDRLRSIDTGDHPVLSVYLGLGADLDELRSVAARLKTMLRPVREAADELAGDAGRSLRADADAALMLADRIGSDLGRGTAMFLCSAAGLEERISLPVGVRDRAIVDPTPYLGPLEAILGHVHRFGAVVTDRRTASIYRFTTDELEAWEVIGEEEVRKENFGGFSGYAERGTRGHAEAVAQRLHRTTAGRIAELVREGAFDLLVVGGNQINIDGLVAEFPADVRERLAGTFVVDPRTTSPSDVLDHCRRLAAEHDRRADEQVVGELMDAAGAGSGAVLGLDRVLAAVNQKAIDRLIVNATETVPGTKCPACGWLARETEECPVCGTSTHRVADLIDWLAEASRADGGSVRYVLGETPMGKAQVGAMVRFPVASIG